MCGIAGLVKSEGTVTAADVAALKRMIDAQSRRGPDGQGVVIPSHPQKGSSPTGIVLGHRRLAILDTSDAGKQPMSNAEGSVWITYNGEIYNFRSLREELIRLGHAFRSRTDAEVVLHGYEAWGIEGLLSRLRGMFAFGLADIRNPTKRLFLARDRFGIKPLYYWLSPGNDCLAFASQVDALGRSGIGSWGEESRAWLGFLLFGSVPTPWTTLKGVQSLPPSHYLVFNKAATRSIRYYDLEGLFSAVLPLQEAEARVRSLLEDTVAAHLLSDVPLGAFLSGGVDSSVLVAIASSHQPELETIGLTFEDTALSEETYQQRVSSRFGTHHNSMRVTPRILDATVRDFLEAMDQPTVDGFNTYLVSWVAKKMGLKSVLSGLGADEVFGGYPTFPRARRLGRIRQLPKKLFQLASSTSSFAKLAFLEHEGSLPLYLVQRGLFTPREAAELIETEEREAWRLIEELEPTRAPSEPARLQQFLETRHYLADQLLRDADVFGMRHSVEIRVPYLDHELAALVFGLNPLCRNGSYKPKWLLIRAVRDLLPEELLSRPKRGFTLPMQSFLSTRLYELTRELPLQCVSRSHNVWEDFASGRSHWSRAWALVVMGKKRAR